MNLGYFFITVTCVLASCASAQEICIVPVKGGQARLPVEFDQPYRIATSPRNVPGYEGLVVKAANRHELYEFDGSNLTLIEGDFPHVWGSAFEHGIHLRPDGQAYGFGTRPRGIFHLEAGEAKWDLIEATKGYVSAFIDQGTGDVYWWAPSTEQPNLIGADGSVERVELPRFHGDDTVSVRTIPELNGALALTAPRGSIMRESSSLWFRPLGKGWQRVTTDLPKGQRLLPTLQDAQVDYSEGVLRVFPENNAFEPLIFRYSEEGLELAGSLPAGVWRLHTPSQNWIGWSGAWVRNGNKETAESHSKSQTPNFLVLRPGEISANEIANILSPSDVRNQRTFQHPEPIVIVGALPALLRSEAGLLAYSGEQALHMDTLLYETIGAHPSVIDLGPLYIRPSATAVFVLHDDLSLRRIDAFPVENPWRHEVDIDYVEAWGAYIVVDKRSGEAYVSWDMESFTRIESAEHLNGVVGVLSEPATVLAIGEQQLVAITRNCQF